MRTFICICAAALLAGCEHVNFEWSWQPMIDAITHKLTNK